MKFSRREIIKLAAAFSAGVAASSAFALSPFVAPSPEKKPGEEENPIDVIDAKNLAQSDEVNDPLVDREFVGDDAYEEYSVEAALELLKEIDGDNQLFVVAGGEVGSTISTALDAASNIEKIKDYVPESTGNNIAISAVSTAVLGWATRKHHAKIASTRSAEHLSDKYGMSAEKAKDLANHEKTMSCATTFLGAALAATVNRSVKFVAGKLYPEDEPEQPFDLD